MRGVQHEGLAETRQSPWSTGPYLRRLHLDDANTDSSADPAVAMGCPAISQAQQLAASDNADAASAAYSMLHDKGTALKIDLSRDGPPSARYSNSTQGVDGPRRAVRH
jgi:hypothetical protein